MNKERLIQIYQDTKNVCLTIDAPVSEKIIGTTQAPGLNKNGIIKIEPCDTVTALQHYSVLGKTAVLNMASSKRRGGGVEKGSIAQEECLFRCSNLFEIPNDFYPIQKNEFIYTKDASFIKDCTYNLMETILADVITMPAVNLNKFHIDNVESDSIDEGYESIMLEKINNMLNIAAINGCDNIILGAWGCGVFKNNPKVVATLFNEVLTIHHKLFNNIVFAVINDRNSVANNFQIFLDTIKTEY